MFKMTNLHFSSNNAFPYCDKGFFFVILLFKSRRLPFCAATKNLKGLSFRLCSAPKRGFSVAINRWFVRGKPRATAHVVFNSKYRVKLKECTSNVLTVSMYASPTIGIPWQWDSRCLQFQGVRLVYISLPATKKSHLACIVVKYKPCFLTNMAKIA